MRLRRFRMLAAILSLMAGFHWVPGALASPAPGVGVICGEAAAAQDAAWQPHGGAHHGAQHECKLCTGTGVSAPALVATVAPGPAAMPVPGAHRCADLSSEAWAPARARPPPRA